MSDAIASAQLGPSQAGCQYDTLHLFFFMVGFARRGVIILCYYELVECSLAGSVWKYCSIGVWQIVLMDAFVWAFSSLGWRCWAVRKAVSNKIFSQAPV